jgi:hypothetical protein
MVDEYSLWIAALVVKIMQMFEKGNRLRSFADTVSLFLSIYFSGQHVSTAEAVGFSLPDKNFFTVWLCP